MNPIQELYQRIEEQALWEKSIRLKRNEYLKTSGRVDTHLYYIESGSLKVCMVSNEEEHIIRLGYKENFIMDIGSFITEKRSEEHTSELQSRGHLVCRLLLAKKIMILIVLYTYQDLL